MPDAPFILVRSLEDLVNPQTRAWRLGATAFGVFGVLAVVVAALGLYSVLAYDVSRRLRELGIRVALGAGRGDIARMVVGRAVRVAVLGALVGFFIAIVVRLDRGAVVVRDLGTRADRVRRGCDHPAERCPARGCRAHPSRSPRVDPIIALRSE